jgi:hypothetical protein
VSTNAIHLQINAHFDAREPVDMFALYCDDEALRRKILIENPTRIYWAGL